MRRASRAAARRLLPGSPGAEGMTSSLARPLWMAPFWRLPPAGAPPASGSTSSPMAPLAVVPAGC
eukprot:960743-Lingulodinium_polyedra.AAC.1